MEQLNTRQWDLYKFIKERTIRHYKTTMLDICTWLGDYYHLNAKECNYTNCPAVYKDINIINQSPEVEKIIIENNNDFFLGTQEQCEQYAIKEKIRALKALKKYWNIQNKINNNSKGKIISCHGDLITEESKARHFVESFVDDLLKENAND